MPLSHSTAPTSDPSSEYLLPRRLGDRSLSCILALEILANLSLSKKNNFVDSADI